MVHESTIFLLCQRISGIPSQLLISSKKVSFHTLRRFNTCFRRNGPPRHRDAVPTLGCSSGNLVSSVITMECFAIDKFWTQTDQSSFVHPEVLCSMLLSRLLATMVAFVVICFLHLSSKRRFFFVWHCDVLDVLGRSVWLAVVICGIHIPRIIIIIIQKVDSS